MEAENPKLDTKRPRPSTSAQTSPPPTGAPMRPLPIGLLLTAALFALFL